MSLLVAQSAAPSTLSSFFRSRVAAIHSDSSNQAGGPTSPSSGAGSNAGQASPSSSPQKKARLGRPRKGEYAQTLLHMAAVAVASPTAMIPPGTVSPQTLITPVAPPPAPPTLSSAINTVAGTKRKVDEGEAEPSKIYNPLLLVQKYGSGTKEELAAVSEKLEQRGRVANKPDFGEIDAWISSLLMYKSETATVRENIGEIKTLRRRVKSCITSRLHRNRAEQTTAALTAQLEKAQQTELQLREQMMQLGVRNQQLELELAIRTLPTSAVPATLMPQSATQPSAGFIAAKPDTTVSADQYNKLVEEYNKCEGNIERLRKNEAVLQSSLETALSRIPVNDAIFGSHIFQLPVPPVPADANNHETTETEVDDVFGWSSTEEATGAH